MNWGKYTYYAGRTDTWAMERDRVREREKTTKGKKNVIIRRITKSKEKFADWVNFSWYAARIRTMIRGGGGKRNVLDDLQHTKSNFSQLESAIHLWDSLDSLFRIVVITSTSLFFAAPNNPRKLVDKKFFSEINDVFWSYRRFLFWLFLLNSFSLCLSLPRLIDRNLNWNFLLFFNISHHPNMKINDVSMTLSLPLSCWSKKWSR